MSKYKVVEKIVATAGPAILLMFFTKFADWVFKDRKQQASGRTNRKSRRL